MDTPGVQRRGERGELRLDARGGSRESYLERFGEVRRTSEVTERTAPGTARVVRTETTRLYLTWKSEPVHETRVLEFQWGWTDTT